jgi:GH15 family glucan-1,4-alpha-glucosidase
VAAPTTSLPEKIGGVRNWDYRFCWLRDATMTIVAMLGAGYHEEAVSWRNWLVRAVAGDPSEIQIMYGIGGERRLTEMDLAWLPGYEDSKPVQIGNEAAEQLQLDIFGAVVEAAYVAARHDIEKSPYAWRIMLHFLEWLETGWKEPDAGIWEVRGPYRHFTHSKVLAWVAFDRAIRLHEEFGRPGPVDRWRVARDAIHAEVLDEAWSEKQQAFAQFYGSDQLDASVLMMPMLGFIPADDPRMVSTVEAICRELSVDGLVYRYKECEDVDGLPAGEGAFLPCSFWLVENLYLQGRHDEAVELFERLLSLRNDLGLISEEYDPEERRQLGNFPQAFTHLALVEAAYVLSGGRLEHQRESAIHASKQD